MKTFKLAKEITEYVCEKLGKEEIIKECTSEVLTKVKQLETQ